MKSGEMDEQGRLVPILREGTGVVRMVFFKALRDDLAMRHAGRGDGFAPRLAGVVLNRLFGLENPDASFVEFVLTNEPLIQEEMTALKDRHAGMRIPLTDALRVQFLCDSLDGGGDESVLSRARDIGILIEDRDVPLPRNFLSLVRKLGTSSGLLIPPAIQEETGSA